MTDGRRVAIVGCGRAGGSFSDALAAVGYTVVAELGRKDDPAAVGSAADIVIIATPDARVADVAASIDPVGDGAALVHVSGSLGLAALAGHTRVGALHPLASLPGRIRGAPLLRTCWFAVAGDPVAAEMADALSGRSFTIADGDRATYHAAACVAANHVVALFGQVERLAASVGVPPAAFIELAAGAIDNVAELGAAAALTGPAARGDDETLARHLAALPADEVATYTAMMHEAGRLARQANDQGAS